jgi:RNA polymerase sigma factor for flagellar operon FliA
MARVVACCDTASKRLKLCDTRELVDSVMPHLESPQRDLRENTLRGIVETLSQELRTRAMRESDALWELTGKKIVVGESIAEYVQRSMTRLTIRGEKRARAIQTATALTATAEAAELVHSDTFHETLCTTWDSSSYEHDIDTYVQHLRRRGLDGEKLCWAVIGRESLNHVLLVKREANRIARMWHDRQADDLVGYGWRGLRLALRSYDPDAAWFSTYACPKIRGAIRDGVRNEHHLPKRLNTFVNKVETAKDELSAALGRHPSVHEIAERLGVDVELVAAVPRYALPASIEASVDEESERQIAGNLDVEESAFDHLYADVVHEALNDLPVEEAEAVKLLVMEQLPMREVRERTGASPKQLRARRDRGLATLRGELDSWA